MSEPPPSRDPFEAFTTAGRFLAISTFVAGGGIFYWYFMFVIDNLPSGSYSLAFLLIPVLIGSAIYFGVGALVLRIFGMRVMKKRDDGDRDP